MDPNDLLHPKDRIEKDSKTRDYMAEARKNDRASKRILFLTVFYTIVLLLIIWLVSGIEFPPNI